MKKTLLFIFFIVTVSKTMGQWIIVDSTITFNDVIHYNPPCLYVSKYSTPRGILINCNNADTFTFVSQNEFIPYGISSIDSYGDSIFCSTNDSKNLFSTNNGTSWTHFGDTTIGGRKLFTHKNFLYLIDDPNMPYHLWRYSLTTGNLSLLNYPVQYIWTISYFSNQNEIYIGAYTNDGSAPFGPDGCLFNSIDDGNTFTLDYRFWSSSFISPGPYINAITKISNDIILIAGDFGLKKSVDNGVSFSNVSYFGQGIGYSLLSTEGAILLCSENGVFISHDTGSNWQAFNDGFSLTTSAGDIKRAGDFLYVTTNHGLWKRSISEITTNVQQIGNNLPQFNVFPTICKDKINIKLSGNTPSENEVKIYDCLGRQVFESSFKVNELQIDVSVLKAGIYFVEIRNGNFQETEKIIVE